MLCRRTHTCVAMSATHPARTCLTHPNSWETEKGAGSSPTGRQSHGPGTLSPYWPTSHCHGIRVWRWSMTSLSLLSTAGQPAWCWRNLWTKVTHTDSHTHRLTTFLSSFTRRCHLNIHLLFQVSPGFRTSTMPTTAWRPLACLPNESLTWRPVT